MKVAMYYRNDDVRTEDVDIPEISNGEMLLKVMAVGICGSDTHEHYRVRHAPLVLGHELAGIVEKVADGVDAYKPGDRLFVFHHVACGACPRCVSGHETTCDTFKKVHFHPGGFAEYVRIHPLQIRLGAIPLPDDLNYDIASFTEPVGCVVRGLRLAGMSPGKRVLILGSGNVGLLMIQVAKATGASRVVATDISEYRKNAAAQFGADFVLDGNGDVASEFRKLNDGLGADIVVLTAMSKPVIQQAIDSVAKGGTILVFGLGAPGVTMDIPLGQFLAGEINIVHSYSGGVQDAKIAFRLITSGLVNVQDMITHRLPLEDAQEGFRLTSAADKSIKVMLYPHGVPKTN